jgi:hypothetical protein
MKSSSNIAPNTSEADIKKFFDTINFKGIGFFARQSEQGETGDTCVEGLDAYKAIA